MDRLEAEGWIRRYQIEVAREQMISEPTYQTDLEIPDDPQIKTEADFRCVGDAYLFFGEVFTAEKVYEKLGQRIPTKKLLEAAERMRGHMALKAAVRCYQLAVDNIDPDEIEVAMTGLRYLRDRHVFAKADTDGVDALIKLIQQERR